MADETVERERYLENLSILFAQPGWADFIATFQEFNAALVAQAYKHRTLEEYFFAKGRADCFEQVLNFERLIKEQIASVDQPKDETEE